MPRSSPTPRERAGHPTVCLHYNFVIMKWWLVLTLIIPFTQQPTKTPPGKRATEANHAQGVGHPKSTNDNQQTSNAAPMTQPSPVPVSKAGIVTPDDETDKGRKHTDDEGLGIQRKLAWFTGALVVVGTLQVVALCGQVYIYCRQAKIMTRQAHEMKRQRGYMRLQWKSMGEQVSEMRRQVIEMASQTEVLKSSVATAEKSAEAANSNANTAKKNIEIFISKERARLRVEMKPLVLPLKPDPAYTVNFTVCIYGPTAAFITESLCVAYVYPLQVIDDPKLAVKVMFPIHQLPAVIPANSPPLDCYAFLSLNSSAEQLLIPEVKARRLFVGIRGFIKYKDVFGTEQVTAFRYVWKYAEGMYGLGEEQDYGDWVKGGKPEENQET
jgi:hypothetical protein